MLRLTLRQARGTAGRLALAGTAIALGTGFVAAVLLTSALFTRTVEATASAGYAGSDVVVTDTSSLLDDAAVSAVASAAGVAAAEGRVDSAVQLVGPARSQYVGLQSTSSLPQLQPQRVVAGQLPTGAGQLALTEGTAARLGVDVGEQVSVRTYPAPAVLEPGEVATAPAPVDVPVTVVGLLAGGLSTPLATTGWALAVPSEAVAWTSGTTADGTPAAGYSSVLAVAAPGTTPEAASRAVQRALAGTAASGALVQTAQERTDQAVEDFAGGTSLLTGLGLAFAALAVFVAGSVITNTFSVLVAQRTRQLALLRCIGATSTQVRRSVLVEAAVLGLLASLVGVLGGTALAVVAAEVLSRAVVGVAVPGGVVLTPAAVLLPVAAGLLAAVLAALAPARAATRVSPLEALRPAGPPDPRTAGSRLRLAASALLVVGGLVLLAGGAGLSTQAGRAPGGSGHWDDLAVAGLPVAVLGGAASFTGVLVGAVFIVPGTVARVGALLARAGGAPARLAALNAGRNPRRTASTTSALLIGTTLVALMVVGAATTSRTLGAALDLQFPVDATVDSVEQSAGGADALPQPVALDPAVVQAARAVPGVRSSALVTTAQATLAGDGGELGVQLAASDEDLTAVLTAPGSVPRPVRGTAVVPALQAEALGVADGEVLELTAGGTRLELLAVVGGLGGQQLLVDPADLRALVPQAAQGALWLHLDPAADPVETVEAVQTAVSDASGDQAVSVAGAAAQRASYEQVIDSMLAVVVALLAVAVVIALVGVANTLSLSVIERTRENAVLRALGLTRGQLRLTLALEGALVAGVGGLLGVVLGSLYGWAGAASLLGGAATAAGDAVWTPSLPWGRLALLLAVAVAAGLLASVLPARRAVRTPPVAALVDQ
ncbi:FtsX-like permease family protein [Quadrisphaera sp. KR29]|uniref:FtsX-like permease family protein n=1 Tax=Quadrisphaera sp. KR29 TaxID=3461391 RepID=UPI004044C53C